ncbi:GNAT family N-acetyltransferase [Spirosoma aureum]|uniref:GNAT family N-acetyltransferase n=1 Tax=Spirosoma aureum TaxID=2692134 RepID=A0A6G9APL5_9BACT|nr:arsenic resistance N-acetyltransferase ArsN2 [Spirosoma aureum]QIP14215.1 GNAT family N-acetyltransferase [Spirosoma aureum]
MSFHIEKALPDDKLAVIALLDKGHLLTDDLPADLTDFVIARAARMPIGVAGLERLNEVGLLRSVVVDPAFQGIQVGTQLVGCILENARAVGLREVYLITTTADRYFERYGFEVVIRQDVPVSIQQTKQFSDLCPSSAIVMKRVLTPDLV